MSSYNYLRSNIEAILKSDRAHYFAVIQHQSQ